MARFSSESIERVRDAVDIAEVLAPYTELKRAGQRLQGLCPFHDERTPSFSVNPQDKLYYCFGCGEKGDVFTFLQEKEGLPFARGGGDACGAVRRGGGARAGGSAARGGAEAEGAAGGGARPDGGLLREVSVGVGRGEEGARVSARAGAERGELAGVRGRVCAEPVGHDRDARAAGRLLAGRAGGGRVGEEGAEGRLDGPLPRADHVPDPRRAGADAGVWRQGDAPGAEGEVRELAGRRAVSQEPACSTGSSGRGRRWRRRGARSWSRDIRT